jgi:hypothetical protein
LNHAREHRRFPERQLIELFAEKHIGRFPDAANRRGPTLAQVDLVAIKRKDVLFGEPAFKRERKHRLSIFTAQSFFRSQISIFDELLGDSRSTLTHLFVTNVSDESASKTIEIDAIMLEEATIFDSEYGVDQCLRNLVITQDLALAGF